MRVVIALIVKACTIDTSNRSWYNINGRLHLQEDGQFSPDIYTACDAMSEFGWICKGTPRSETWMVPAHFLPESPSGDGGE
jgi:hypothetical protein